MYNSHTLAPAHTRRAETSRVAAVPEKPFYNSVRLQFSIPTADGPIRMVDYASADNWNGRRVTTWMPVR